MWENVIWNFFSILNSSDPLLDAIPADCPDGPCCLSVAFYFIWVQILKGRIKETPLLHSSYTIIKYPTFIIGLPKLSWIPSTVSRIKKDNVPFPLAYLSPRDFSDQVMVKSVPNATYKCYITNSFINCVTSDFKRWKAHTYTLLMTFRVRAANLSFMGTCVLPSATGLRLSRNWSTHSLKVGIRLFR